MDYQIDKTIVQLFEEQIQKIPNQIAVIFEKKQLTYQELNEKANQLANYLQAAYAIKENDVIALQLERSEWMIISILAILKLGAAYLPIALNFPKARVKYMLKDSAAKVLLTASIENINLSEYNRQPSVVNHQSSNLAYILYTSGSTGNPKGVEMPHRSLVNLIQWQVKNSTTGIGDRTIQFVPYTFDVSFQEIFATFCSGGTLVLLPSNLQKDIQNLPDFIHQYQINRIFLPFVALNSLAELVKNNTQNLLSSLKSIITAGEQLQSSQALKTLMNSLPNAVLKNQYGPTEAHVVSEYVLPKDTNVWSSLPPIGQPIDNTKLYILDKNWVSVPTGETGELYIGGICLANGYLNNAALTAEKFIKHLPIVSGIKNEERLYKTGDLARQLPDGNIEFLGRIDHQLKIRGYRIETGEIEQNLLAHEEIHSAVVVGHKMEQAQELVAYLVLKTTQNTTTLRVFLEQRLPDYMIPSLFVVLDKLPQTSSGKVDRKALPYPDSAILLDSGIAYTAPRNNTEEQLVNIWQKVLNKTNISIHDNFFVLGGHSLKAIRVIALIQQTFSVILKLSEVFAHPTIEDLAKKIDTQKNCHSVILQPIPKIKKQQDYPLSNAQRRLWIPIQLGEEVVAYNMFFVYEMNGALNIKVLEQAFETIIQRHEILRTRFVLINGAPRQVITVPQPFRLPCLNWKDKNKTALDNHILKNHIQHVFNLSQDSLLRVELVKTAHQKQLLLLNVHHIISDGWSMEILMRELTTVYNASVNQLSNPLKPLPIQYKDYAVWQKQLLSDTSNIERLRQYWKAKLADYQLLELPTDHQRPAIQQYDGETLTHIFKGNQLQQLETISQKHGTSLFVVLTTFVKILLHRYTNQTDIIIGTGIAGRNHPDLYEQLGFYLNMLPLRSEIDGTDSFENVLAKVKNTVLEAFEYDDYPYDMMVEDLKMSRNLSRNPIFDVAIILQNNEIETLDFQDLKVNNLNIEDKSSKFDLTFIFDTDTGELRTSIEYSTHLFEKNRIERMRTHLVVLIESALKAPKKSIGQLNILPKSEQQLLTTFNQTKVDFPNKDKTIVQFFEEQVEQTPNNIAVVFEEKQLTYKELNEKANQLANYLYQKYNTKGDDIIALQLERSEWMIIAILGVMKSGAAYLPIAPDMPKARAGYMLKDSNAKALLSDNSTFETAQQFEIAVENIETIDYNGLKTNHQSLITNHQLAYIIYTSGSTGQPKGVMIEHRNVVNFINYPIELFKITPADNILLFSTYTFDTSIAEIFMGILTGASLFVIDPQKMSLDDFLNYIKKHKISVLDLPPKFLNAFEGKYLGNLRILTLGGEAPDAQVLRWYTEKYRCFNAYGPTEATVCTTLFEIPPNWSASFIPIGKPFQNVATYILNNQYNTCPIGIAGELCISGAGLARGYLNNIELTAEKFIPNPFNPDERLYKTGDLARWLPDGNIEFLGRIDNQLKIRGYRIEAGEIEQILLSHESIQSAVIVGADFGNGKELVAYLVAKTGEEIPSVDILRMLLVNNLPNYMIPNHFMVLETLPLTNNGKVNRKALLNPENFEGITLATNRELTYVSPRNETEEALVEVWQTIFNHEKVGINDNFFNLGGHSLRAIRMVTLIQQTLAVEIKLSEIFTHPTIAELGQIIGEMNIKALLENTKKQSNYPIQEEYLEEEIW
ncbi:MAG: amino acid adenylation domain-containing protein [Saprospiraceae bacterium]